MGLIFITIFFALVIGLLRQLRLRGCVFWLLWMVVGAGVAWVLLGFVNGFLRV